MKLYGAGASIRTALQSATPTKYLTANNPDEAKVKGKKLPKQDKGRVSKALMEQRGQF